MVYQLCMRDEYSQSSILYSNEDLQKVLKRCKREINAVNVENALTVEAKKQNWECFMVVVERSEDKIDTSDEDGIGDNNIYTYAGKDGRGVDQVFDEHNELVPLSSVNVNLKMYLGDLDGKAWYAYVPSKKVRGQEEIIDSLDNPALQGKDIYYIRPV